MAESTNADVQAARGGSPEAFARLYERLAPAVAAWANVRTRGAVRDRVDPDDLTQEIWWNALQSFGRFDPARGNFRGWLFGVAANTFRNLARRSPGQRAASVGEDSRYVELPSELQAQLTSITADVRRRDRVSDLVSVVNALDDDDRRLFTHCGLEGAMLKEVAPILGITENAAKKRWSRLRQKLEKHPLIEEFIEA